MSFGQTMISAAFLVLLTIAVFNASKMIVDKDETYYKHEALKQASYLANSLLTEIARKKFDEQADTSLSYMQPVTDFTTSGNLGTDPFIIWTWTYNESYLVPQPDYFPYQSVVNHDYYYDDIDDYNGYYRIDTTTTYARDTLTVEVYYITPDGTNSEGYVTTTTRTYYKKVDVHVLNRNYFNDTLTFSTIIAY